eukprot:gene25356-11018_t
MGVRKWNHLVEQYSTKPVVKSQPEEQEDIAFLEDSILSSMQSEPGAFGEEKGVGEEHNDEEKLDKLFEMLSRRHVNNSRQGGGLR